MCVDTATPAASVRLASVPDCRMLYPANAFCEIDAIRRAIAGTLMFPLGPSLYTCRILMLYA